MARKFSMGVFSVLLETLGIFWVLFFAPIRSSLLLEIQSTSRALKWQGILTVEALFSGQLPGASRKSVHTRSQLTVYVTGMFLSKTLFTWSGGPRSSGVGFFCFHALADTKQKRPTPLHRGPPLHANRP